MDVIDILAAVGSMFNDIASILSVLGSTILLFGAFSKTPLRRYGRIADWSLVGLGMGILFQISMAISGTMPEQIGFVFPMPPLMVSALLGVSLLMLVGRWVIRRILHTP